MVNRPSKTPKRRATLYQHIADTLIDDIRNGVYPVGSKLPTEMELCEIFRVGRQTAREAIRKLSELGLIERRRRAGTTVIRQHPSPQFGLALDTTDQLERYLRFTDLHVQNVVHELTQQPAEVALDGSPGDWIKVETYRSVPGTRRAISWSDIYLRREFTPIVEHIAKSREGVYPLLHEHCDEEVRTIEMEISAARFPVHIASFLGYKASDPALLMIRTFRNDVGNILEVAVSYYPPYDFKYVTRLERDVASRSLSI